MQDLLKQLHNKYEKDGFIFPVQVISSKEAIIHKQKLEDAEKQHYLNELYRKTAGSSN